MSEPRTWDDGLVRDVANSRVGGRRSKAVTNELREMAEKVYRRSDSDMAMARGDCGLQGRLLAAALRECAAWREAHGHCDVIGYVRGDYDKPGETTPESVGLAYAITGSIAATDAALAHAKGAGR